MSKYELPRKLNFVNQKYEQWIEESFHLINLSLGNEGLVDSVINQLVEKFPLNTFSHPYAQKAAFFEELEKHIQSIAKGNSPLGRGQLELFKDWDESTPSLKGEFKDPRLVRAEAFLAAKQEKISCENDGINLRDPFLFKWIIEFSYQYERKILLDQSEYSSELQDRDQDLSKYLLGVLTDKEAIMVEEKCRLFPDWQEKKLSFEKVINLFDQVVKCRNQSNNQPILPICNNSKDRMLKELNKLEERSSKESMPSFKISEVDMHSSCLGQSDGSVKWLFRGFILTGCLACLIGYFGWTEKVEIEPSVQQVPLSSNPSNSKETLLSLDQIKNLPLLMAEKTAHSLLGQRTIQELDEMEESMQSIQPIDINQSKLIGIEELKDR